ncbi:MAG: ribosomal RNA small subunit methyltransferase A [Thermoproteota archaeon]|nr:MAG: ribosomal RNA small subunit methyltransferase A [Candidatus Korarchaeota archaeon]
MTGEHFTSNDLKRRALEFLKTRSLQDLKERDQHFMINRKELRYIVDVANISNEDVVLEIGAGLGFLTEEILSRDPKAIFAVEKDPELASLLKKRFGDEPRVKVICRDILELLPFKGKYTKVVANPPFSISSRILLGLLNSEFKIASITFQYEFAERLVATPGSSSYGSLTVLTSLKFNAALVKRVHKSSFIPKPEVDAALVKLEEREPVLDSKSWDLLNKMLPSLFERRKRKLSNALEDFIVRRCRIRRTTAKELVKRLISEDIRVYKTPPSEFARLAEEIRDYLAKPS